MKVATQSQGEKDEAKKSMPRLDCHTMKENGWPKSNSLKDTQYYSISLHIIERLRFPPAILFHCWMITFESSFLLSRLN